MQNNSFFFFSSSAFLPVMGTEPRRYMLGEWSISDLHAQSRQLLFTLIPAMA